MEKRINTDKARKLRKEMTEAERKLWQALRAGELSGFKFRRQHAIGPYIVDFVCIQASLVIEADGGQHAEQLSYDAERTKFLEGHGFKVLRYWNSEIFLQTESVLEQIWNCLQQRHPHPNPLPQAGEGA